MSMGKEEIMNRNNREEVIDKLDTKISNKNENEYYGDDKQSGTELCLTKIGSS